MKNLQEKLSYFSAKEEKFTTTMEITYCYHVAYEYTTVNSAGSA
jgi:hypothetical protein